MATHRETSLLAALLRLKLLLRSIPKLTFLCPILLILAATASAQTSSQQYVYLSVPGSPSSAVSGFSKASQTGALGTVPNSPFNERLEGGLVAIDGQGKFLFVLNSKSNDISMFQVDQASGAISEVPGSPFAVPPTINPNMVPSQPISMAAESSGKFLFVGYFSGDIQGQSSVASLSIDTSGATPVLLTLQSIETSTGGAPVQLLPDPKGLHLYVGLSRGQNGLSDGGAEVYSINSATGQLAYQGMADLLNDDGLSYAIDPQGRFFYAGGRGNVGPMESCIISPVDGTANTCQPIFDLGFQNYPTVMVAENSGHFLYIDQSATGGVVAYSVDQTTGALTQTTLAPFTSISFLPGGTVADPMGPYIYSATFTAPAAIHAYQVDQQTGNLTEIPGSPFSSGLSPVGCCGGLAISGNPVQAVTGPAVTIFPSSARNFGAVVGSASVTQVFSIVNTGNQLLAINSISISGTSAANFSQTNTCAATLSPNSNCSVSIGFIPPSVGTFTASLQIADNAPGTPQTLALSGVGIAPQPGVTFSPTVPAFPTTTQGTSSPPQTLNLMSTGNAPLHVSSVSLSGPNATDFSFTNNCTSAVAPGSNCTISLVFSPLGPGQRTASLMISDDATASPQSVSLSATANPAITAAAAPGSSMSATVSAGQPAQYQLQLTPGTGFSGTVSLSCSGAPLNAACQVPATLSLTSGTTATFTVTVTTSGSAGLLPSAPIRFRRIPAAPVLPLLALVLLFLLLESSLALERNGPARRPASRGIVAALFFCGMFALAGCGGGTAAVAPPPPPPIVTPPGTSTITVTLAATSLSGQPLQLQPIPLQLTVK